MKLEEIRALIEAATPGPWKHDWGNHDVEGARPERAEIVVRGENGNYNADLEFIAASRILIPKLLAVAEAAKEATETERWLDEEISTGLRKKLLYALAALEAE
jgi:hypothetical protein